MRRGTRGQPPLGARRGRARARRGRRDLPGGNRHDPVRRPARWSAKTGAIRLSLASGVPITPMASWGSAAVWQKSGRGSLKPGRPVWVKCGTPYAPRVAAGVADDHDAIRALSQRPDGSAHGSRDRPARPLPRALVARGVGWGSVADGGRGSRRARSTAPRCPRWISGPRACRSTRPRRSGSMTPTRTRRRSPSAEPGYTYTRGYGNPTLDAFEALIADLEETEAAMSFASGMAAIHTLWTSHTAAGSRIVASRELYGGRLRARDPGPPAVRRDGRPGRRARPRRGRGRASGRGAVLHRDDREPDDVGRRSGSARRSVSCGVGVPAAVDNTFASPVPVHAVAFRVRLLAALDDEVPRRAPRPHGRRDRDAPRPGAGRSATPSIDTGGTMAPVRGVARDARGHDARAAHGPALRDGARTRDLPGGPSEG